MNLLSQTTEVKLRCEEMKRHFLAWTLMFCILTVSTAFAQTGNGQVAGTVGG